MPRRAAPSDNVLARIRAWFGLRQDQLALYLAVSPVLVQAIEAGRRGMSLAVTEAALPLVQQLPAVAVADSATTTLPPGAPAPDVAALDFRRRVCLQRADKLRDQAESLVTQAHHAHRWAEALPALLPPADTPDTERTTWLRGWLQRRSQPLPAADVTRWYLLQAQIQAYEAEAAALAAAISA